MNREQLEKSAKEIADAGHFGWGNVMLDAAATIDTLKALSARLKQEAQIHAQEARTANATIAEIYQCVTGATGEPGNWNGANPVREKLATLTAQRDAAVKDSQRLDWLQRNCSGASDSERYLPFQIHWKQRGIRHTIDAAIAASEGGKEL